MASDDPQVSLATLSRDPLDPESEQEIAARLAQLRTRTHLSHLVHPAQASSSKAHRRVIDEIHHERKLADRDEVSDDWFAPPGGTRPRPRRRPQRPSRPASRQSHHTDHDSEDDDDESKDGFVKFTIKRVSNKGRDTLRKLTLRSSRDDPSDRPSNCTSPPPDIVVEPGHDDAVEPEGSNDAPLAAPFRTGSPLGLVRTTSTFSETIALPHFDPRASSSSDSIATASFTSPSSPSRKRNTLHWRRRTPEPRHDEAAEHEDDDDDDQFPPPRVPTPPPFPDSPYVSNSAPLSPINSHELSPSVASSSSSSALHAAASSAAAVNASSGSMRTTSPFFNLTSASLPPLSEEKLRTPRSDAEADAEADSDSRTPMLTRSPTGSLLSSSSIRAASPTRDPLSTTLSNLAGLEYPPTRTLTLDNGPSGSSRRRSRAPSRRDTLSSILPRRGSNLLSNLRQHLPHPLSSSQSSDPSGPRSSLDGSTARYPPPRPPHHRSPSSISTMNSILSGSGGKRRHHPHHHFHTTFDEKYRRNKRDLEALFRKKARFEQRERAGRRRGRGAGRHERDDEEKEIEGELLKKLKDLGAIVEERDQVETDVLWEHQRGLVIFGLPKFSSAALFQFDPAVWTDDTLRPSPFTPRDYPCRPYWNWRDQEFMVDMGGDKDEEGWSYAFFFHSKHWRGEPSVFRSFVRRRKWIRTRIYRPSLLLARYGIGSEKPKLVIGEGAEHGVLRGFDEEWQDEDQQAAPGADAKPDRDRSNGGRIGNLKDACRCLPLTVEQKVVLYESLVSIAPHAYGSSPASASASAARRRDDDDDVARCELNPFNPFVSLKIMRHLASIQPQSTSASASARPSSPAAQRPSSSSSSASRTPATPRRMHSTDPVVWRDALREINLVRCKQALRRYARIDRERLQLWRVWFQAETDEDDADPRRPRAGRGASSASTATKANGTGKGKGKSKSLVKRRKGIGCREWEEWRAKELGLDGNGLDEDSDESSGAGPGREEPDSGESDDFQSVYEGDEGERREGADGNVDAKDFARLSKKERDEEASAEEEEDPTGNDSDDEDEDRPDLEDVWDLVEGRLDEILQTFDYHLNRLAFLRLVLSLHPLASTPWPASSSTRAGRAASPSRVVTAKHRHEHWDTPFEARRKEKEKEWERRLRWVVGIREEIKRAEEGEADREVVASLRNDESPKDPGQSEDARDERKRIDRTNRKGKQRALYA
ncbi:hypothetical protein JCM10212_004438 [Sporobolomyces blumeae]